MEEHTQTIILDLITLIDQIIIIIIKIILIVDTEDYIHINIQTNQNITIN